MKDDLLRVTVFAPAKVNLTLHVTGQREDGYHTLDSLIAFATVGDRLEVTPGNTLSLTCEGPEGQHVPADMENLIIKVARLFDDITGAAFVLDKQLPVSSGIGGGSADAAAAFRALMSIRNGGAADDDDAAAHDPGQTPFAARVLALGADIPACLLSEVARMQGVGEKLTVIPDMKGFDAVLVNPRIGVSTPQVFAALENKSNPAMSDALPRFAGLHDFVLWLTEQRNDLQAPAIELVPQIRHVIAALEHDKDCLLARMSGSGATCFGVFSDGDAANAAAKRLSQANPDWWVRPVRLTSMGKAARPRVQRHSDENAASLPG
ncbi:4-(cytidine 5'-diphospho)-2-C-methyl-D-erythritol kinase [Sulfitobacter sp. JB4-11]|uniref:4-(cytidine 5'-diphospho)-2-C-methyl-D-erythritol kinase n=1 Tax=Sulfitobacter rhodophyticola TaxID=3238304 RepID=UPI003516E104